VTLAGVSTSRTGQAILVDDGVDLGAQSAARTTNGVIFAAFLRPRHVDGVG
jgi:hypothetical protein